MRSQIRKLTCAAGLVALAAIVSAGGARAGTITIFSNYFACSSGPNCYNQTNSYGIVGSLEGASVIAMPFTAGSTADLADAVLPLRNTTLPGFASNPMTLDLESTSATTGLPSGTILANLTQQGTITSSSTGGLVTFDYSGAPVPFAQGTQYWLVALQTGGTVNGWFFSGVDFGIFAFSSSGSANPASWNVDNSTRSAFLVDGTPVTTTAPTPEPASLLLLGTGLLGVALLVRRRHDSPGVRI